MLFELAQCDVGLQASRLMALSIDVSVDTKPKASIISMSEEYMYRSEAEGNAITACGCPLNFYPFIRHR